MDTAAPRAEVTVYSPLFSPFRHQLQGPSVSIGRASDCSIPIKDRYLSRKHAEIATSLAGAKLDEKTRARTEEASLRRLVREQMGLPRLTLFT